MATRSYDLIIVLLKNEKIVNTSVVEGTPVEIMKPCGH